VTEKETSPQVIDAIAPIAALSASCKAMGEALKATGTTGRIVEAQPGEKATPFDHARAHLMGRRWTEQEGARLKEIIDQGTEWAGRNERPDGLS
jgi:hypothetical protein